MLRKIGEQHGDYRPYLAEILSLFYVLVQIHILEHIAAQFIHSLRFLLAQLCLRFSETVFDHVTHQSIDPLFMSVSQYSDAFLRQIIRCDDTAPQRIIDIVIDVCDPVAHSYYLTLWRDREHLSRVTYNTIPDLLSQIHASAVAASGLQNISDTQTLLIMMEPSGIDLI